MIGDVLPDITLYAPDPAQGPSAGWKGPFVTGGGAAANTAVALARLGTPVSFVGGVGSDWPGRSVLEELRGEGVDTSGVVVLPEAPTPLVFALVRPDGEPALIRWPADRGSDWSLRPEDVNPAQISSAAWLHATGISLTQRPARDAVLRAMELARAGGVTVSFDLNFRPERREDDPGLQPAFAAAIAASDVLFGHGVDEFIAFTGRPSVPEAMRELSAGRRTVVARLGARGVMVATPEEEWAAPAFSVQVVDTVGAGDAFNGGFIAAARAGMSRRESIRWGLAVAGLKVSAGGARALPSRPQVEALLASNPQAPLHANA